MLAERPLLPPGWFWHENAGSEKMSIKWLAYGPDVSGRPLVAHARIKPDTPEGCAHVAWELWSHLSGLPKEVGLTWLQRE